jgi:uncharacterized protein (TIGR02246 family)
MTSRLKFAAISFLALLIAVPFALAAARDPSISREVDAVRQVGKSWMAFYQAGNYAAIPDLYTEDTMVMPRGRPRIEGREQLRRSLGGLAAGRKVDIDITEKELTVAGDVAWFVSDFKVTYTSTDPSVAPHSEYGRSLIIYRKGSDGKWRIHRDMDSPAPIAGSPPQVSAPAAPPVWDPATRTTPTECDRLSAGRYDRERLAKPVARADIDVPAAIRQCEADLAKLPDDPRLLFQLGRLYGYTPETTKAREYRERAAAVGNPNAIFLLGYLDFLKAKSAPERCTAADRMVLAADRGNYSGQVTVTAYVLGGRLHDCIRAPGPMKLRGYLESARKNADGFFESLLIEHLQRQLAPATGDSAR